MDIRFVVPGNVRHGSGGNKYNAALAQHLTALGAQVETVTVDGDWPVGSEADRKRFAQALDGGTVDLRPLAARSARREPLPPPLGVNRDSLSVNPAIAQRDLERLGPGERP